MSNAEKLIPYEFHVTVENVNTDIETFINTCDVLDSKAIILDLGINNNTYLADYMTSSTRLYPDDQSAFAEVNRLADGLSAAGFNVIRRKIESAPWHPSAPQSDHDHMPQGSYFESHLAIEIMPDQIPSLRKGIDETHARLPLHISRNVFKKSDDGKVIIMSTLRDDKTSYKGFLQAVADSKSRVKQLGFTLKKEPVVEFALFDSNTHQDDAWMRK